MALVTAQVHLVPEVYAGHPLTFIELDGRPHVVAREVGKTLGYANDGGEFVNSLREWAEDLRPGEHVVKVEGEQLGWLKDRLPAEMAGSRSRHLILLTDRGLLRALMLAGGPVAVRFRDWAEEVLHHRVSRGAALQPAPAAPPPDLDAAAGDVRRAEALLHLAQLARRTSNPKLAHRALHEASRLLISDDVELDEPPLDEVQRFLAERCRVGPEQGSTTFDVIYKAYAAWCSGMPSSKKYFSMRLAELGVRRSPGHRSARVLVGISLRG